MAAAGCGLAAGMRQERGSLVTSIDAELAALHQRRDSLRAAAQSGSVPAGQQLTSITRRIGDLSDARQALNPGATHV